MNDPVIRWFCALVRDVYETVQHRALGPAAKAARSGELG
jgi:hypothetical protein